MLKEIRVPDIGNFASVPVIEILVSEGDEISADASLITLETDKATMEVPAPQSGRVKSLKLKLNDRVSVGDLILELEVAESAKEVNSTTTMVGQEMKQATPNHLAPPPPSSEQLPKPKLESPAEPVKPAPQVESSASDSVYAGPGSRRLARVLGVDLTQIHGSGAKGRVLRTDVESFVKQLVQSGGSGTGGTGFQVMPLPAVDHSRWGAIEIEPLSRIKKISGAYLQRNWVTAPHVTQFDEADITELEQFRRESQEKMKEGVKLTFLSFLLKAVAASLQAFPHFNASLSQDGSELIIKKYYHIGVAVDTPQGLVVPVLRDVNSKGAVQLASELAGLSQQARAGKLQAADMQGGGFSISSLGGIGGTAFTPIINLPEVAILGVSKSNIKAVYSNGAFVPRLMLPLSLSYDHRVIDGAEAARFTSYLAQQLSDVRRLLL